MLVLYSTLLSSQAAKAQYMSGEYEQFAELAVRCTTSHQPYDSPQYISFCCICGLLYPSKLFFSLETSRSMPQLAPETDTRHNMTFWPS